MAVFETSSEAETTALAAQIASSAKAGDVFFLEGTLGAGKSVFARGFVRAFCGSGTEVPSPTFTLVQTYDAPLTTIWHFDLYRIQNPEEIFEIGWEEALSGGIVLIEWPERLGHYKPAKAKKIQIQPLTGETRRITINE